MMPRLTELTGPRRLRGMRRAEGQAHRTRLNRRQRESGPR
jgi:hypothetical protein